MAGSDSDRARSRTSLTWADGGRIVYGAGALPWLEYVGPDLLGVRPMLRLQFHCGGLAVRSAGDQAIPALAETAADDTLVASSNVQSDWRRG